MTPNQILRLHQQGWGQKKIARHLGISEWQVRCTVRANLTQSLQKSQERGPTETRLRLADINASPTKPLTAIIFSDVHIPHHDQRALGAALSYMDSRTWDDIILNGDIVDFYAVSSYRKDPTRLETFQDELNETAEFLKHIRTAHPEANITYLEGNHEERLRRFLLDKAPELTSLTCLAFDELLKLNELDIKFVDYGQSIHLGQLEVTHGNSVRAQSAASAKAHFEKSGSSILIGHTHRLGTYYKTNRWGTHVCLENGFLGRNDFDYVNKPDWQHGFTTVEYYEDGRFFTRQHCINNGSLVVDGTLYEAA